MEEKNSKVLVGMSGGVDSSVAVLLLQKEGYYVTGVFIDFIGGEKGTRDFQKAQDVADKLNIPIYKVDAREIFQKKIIDKFVSDYESGITPNPCVICNPQMKFKILIEEADRLGIDLVATGHYARLGREFPISNFQFPNKSQMPIFKLENKKNQTSSVNCEPITSNHPLLVAKDLNKDQSYFLYRLTPEQLGRVIFPLGDYLKSEVRKIAQENNFEIKNEEESQDVCFITNNDFNKFISEKIKNNPGEIINMEGKKLGEHKGLHFYTIGQRRGINLGGDGPYFVIKKDKIKNQLIVSNKADDLDCPEGTFRIKDANWIRKDLEFPLRTKVKTRYRSQEKYVIIVKENEDFYQVKFDKNQRAITQGQSAVFYADSGEILGGGIII